VTDENSFFRKLYRKKYENNVSACHYDGMTKAFSSVQTWLGIVQ